MPVLVNATGHGWWNLFQSGGALVHIKKIVENFLWFELATVTSQALKYDVITYAHHLKV